MTKYGYLTIGIVFLIAVALVVLALFIHNSLFRFILIAVALFMLAFTLNFFRDPERISPVKDNVIVSPADGTVILVKEVQENRFIRNKAIQISIFMSPLNVHVNRIPINGKVNYLRYIKGKYLVANNVKASDENERSEIGISSKFGKIFFTQVAGYVARRIIYELKEGDSVKIGNRFGMIKFGSRVDVIAPVEWKVKIKEGEKVKAGETILFEYPKK